MRRAGEMALKSGKAIFWNVLCRTIHGQISPLCGGHFAPFGGRGGSVCCGAIFGGRLEEIGALSGILRQNANLCLKLLGWEGLLRLESGGVTTTDRSRSAVLLWRLIKTGKSSEFQWPMRLISTGLGIRLIEG